MCKILEFNKSTKITEAQEDLKIRGSRELRREDLEFEFKDETFLEIDIAINQLNSAMMVLKQELGKRDYRRFASSPEGYLLDQIHENIDTLYVYKIALDKLRDENE